MFPPGYRFCPTDEELVHCYLVNKVAGKPLPSDEPVKFCDLYSVEEPWEIWERFAGPSLPSFQDLFFFTHLKKKDPKGNRIDRRVGNGGSWHGEDKGRKFTADGVNCIVKRFRYENSKLKEQDGRWIMMEYSLQSINNNNNNIVLCRMRENPKKRKFQNYLEGQHVAYQTPSSDQILEHTSSSDHESIILDVQPLPLSDHIVETSSSVQQQHVSIGEGSGDDDFINALVEQLSWEGDANFGMLEGQPDCLLPNMQYLLEELLVETD